MKNRKLATKICLIMIATLTIGLLLVWGITEIQVSKSMKETVVQKMNDAVITRLEIVMGYVDKAETYLATYAQEPNLKALLKNQQDAVLTQEVQDYTDAYGNVNPDLENVYLANYESTVLTSYVHAANGITLRTGDGLKALQDSVFATKGIYNTGIMTSPSTGQQVVSLYYPIFDGEDRIGYVGAAICAESLRNTLKSLAGEDNMGCSYLLLDAAANTYIFCEDDSLIGTQIEDEAVLSFMEQATLADSGSLIAEKGNSLVVSQYIQDRNWVFLAMTDKNVVFASSKRLSVLLAVICIAVLILISFIVFLAVNLIAKDLTNLGTIISDIGTLNLRGKEQLAPYMDRGDEVGIIANATNHLAESICSVIADLKRGSESLYDTSRTMMENATVTLESIKGVETAIQEIANGANEQASETQQASESVVHIGGMIETSSGKASELSGIANNIRSASDDVGDTLKLLNEINEQAKGAIEEINKQTNSTNESAIRIKEAAGLITSIAEETNLLSLNASIEAARAGEQGRGFAVVASQIQTLADQSNKSAKQIEQIINALIEDSSNAVSTMSNVMAIMDEKSRHLTSTKMQFDKVNEGITDTRNGIVTITDAISDMDKERINVVDVVQNLTAIAQENAASTEETLASTEIVSNMMDKMSEIASRVSEISDEIEKSIDGFII